MMPDGDREPVRYAVVGLGWISQQAVLPAFANADENSRIGALVSGNADKLEGLGERYGIEARYGYDEFDACLESGEVDAVYVALPNHLHHEYAVRAARAGIHVLCEKPMAITEDECEAMIRAADENGARLMIAYRLHFEEANMRAVEIAASGTLGEPRLFESVFSHQVREGDIRLRAEMGGGTLFDIGIYCINAARYLFRDEPVEVRATAGSNEEERFREVPEMTTSVLRFPGDRLASFTCSFGAAAVDAYRLVGTRGDLLADPGYEFDTERGHRLTVDGETRERRFPRCDQFAPLLLHFSDCVRTGREPRPSGREGLADVRIIRALRRSIEAGGEAVELPPFDPGPRPGVEQAIFRPPVDAPELVETSAPGD